jgi:hypothetical protein
VTNEDAPRAKPPEGNEPDSPVPRGKKPGGGGKDQRHGPRARSRHRSGRRLARRRSEVEEPRLGLARHIVERLRQLARILYEEATTGRDARPLEAPFDVKILLHPEGASPGAVPAGEDALHLLGALRRRVSELAVHGQVYRSGRVFCYWCETSGCAHAVPPGESAVFGGYMPTGRPAWRDFASAVLARRDPRVEGLYRKPPETIAFVESEEELAAAQLPTFGKGSPAYQVIGQIALGYLRVPDSSGGPLAMTLQVVRSIGSAAEIRLDLNVLGVLADGRDAESLFADGFEPDLDVAIRWARGALGDAERRLNAVRKGGDLDRAEAVAPEVRPVLDQLERRLEKIFRQRVRRTAHARERAEEGERPTRNAVVDARRAGDHEILVDGSEETIVVVGAKGRVHVFSPGGRLVTSILLSRNEVDRRLLRKRWRPARPGEIESFRRALEPRSGQEGEE